MSFSLISYFSKLSDIRVKHTIPTYENRIQICTSWESVLSSVKKRTLWQNHRCAKGWQVNEGGSGDGKSSFCKCQSKDQSKQESSMVAKSGGNCWWRIECLHDRKGSPERWMGNKTSIANERQMDFVCLQSWCYLRITPGL